MKNFFYLLNNYKKFKAFTLAEVLITLVIIGVVSALTIPTIVTKYQERQTVARVRKAYATITQAWNRYQVDNSCAGGNIVRCYEKDLSVNGGNIMDFYNRFIKYLNYVDITSQKTDIRNVGWLPNDAYNLDGSKVVNADWLGVSKSYGSSWWTIFFRLTDGTIFHMQAESTDVFMFFDTNGVKGPNRIGKDQFPIGIGAQNNKKYEGIVHPFYNENNEKNYGLCNIRDNSVCDPDICTKTSCSPTAYVLKNNKLPPITW